MIKFPYDISNFESIILENYFYVDRTDRIPLIEEAGKQLLFLRPRRFGKSLLLSMLGNYYDAAKADRFESLFGHLAIGKKPTPLHNRFFVMNWDFSVVDPQGSPEDVKKALHQYLNIQMNDFVVSYQDILPLKIEFEPSSALVAFQSILTSIQQTPYKLYLLIDEYDNFANEIMMGGQQDRATDRYEAVLYGEGTLRTLFKLIKSAATGGGLERVFITGVSPVVLSDITSGYNVAKSISFNKQFNDLCGLREFEIKEELKQIADECKYPAEETDRALNMMRTFYNGYSFSYGEKADVYNTTLALYFFDYFQETCKYPRNMLDSNLAMDREKIQYISSLPKGDRLIAQDLEGEPPVTVSMLHDRFGVKDMLTVPKDYNFMASLLYYFGVLTMAGETEFSEIILKIPNLVIRRLYVEELKNTFLDTDRYEADMAAKALYQQGDIQPICDFIQNRFFKVLDNRDYRWSNELTVKTAFLTLLFNDAVYVMDSETELGRRYADLTMIVRPDKRHSRLLDILIEFKYISLSDAGLTVETAKKMSNEELKAIPAIEKKLLESKQQAEINHKILERKYTENFRLHSFGVVAAGFKRLVWVSV